MIRTSVTPNDIHEVYNALNDAQEAFQKHAAAHADAVAELERAEARAIRDGVPGSNAQKRKANLASFVEAEQSQVRVMEGLLDAAKARLVKAENEVARVRLLVRYDEIASRLAAHAAKES